MMSVGCFLLRNHVIGCTTNRLHYEVVEAMQLTKDGGHAVIVGWVVFLTADYCSAC